MLRRKSFAVAGCVLLLVSGLLSAGVPSGYGASADELRLVSVNGSDVAGGRDSGSADATADGSWIAFDTEAALSTFDTFPGRDVYVRGAGRTVLLSGFGGGQHPAISSNGRYVAFDSYSDGAGSVIVVCDRDPDDDGEFDEPTVPAGVAGTSAAPEAAAAPPDHRCVVLPADSAEGPEEPQYDSLPDISADAGTVVWTRRTTTGHATTMVAALPHDEQGRLGDAENIRELRPTEADYRYVLGGDGRSRISADGSTVVFPMILCRELCGASLRAAPGDAGPLPAVYQARLDPFRMSRVDTGAHDAVVSGDGSTIAYVAGGQLRVRSERSPDEQAVAVAGEHPALSGDGRYLAYLSGEVQVRDLVSDRGRVANGLPPAPAQRIEGTGDAGTPEFSADARVLVFDTAARLAARDTNDEADVYARTFRPAVRMPGVDIRGASPEQAANRVAYATVTGFGPVVLRGLRVSGDGFTAFSDCVGATLHGGDRCAITVRLAPSAPGPHTGSLLLDTSSGAVRVPLRADVSAASPAGAVTASPRAVRFAGNRLPLSDGPRVTVTVRNGTDDPVIVRAVQALRGPRLFPGDYPVRTGCVGTWLQPGGTCPVQVRFLPYGGGPRPGALQVTTDAGAVVVDLTGTAEVPAVTLDPAIGPGGRVIGMRGQGFPADTVLRLTGPSLLPVVLRSDATGHVRTHLLPPRYPDASVPSVSVHVPGTGIAAAAPLLLVAGSFQPPGFHTRR